MYRNANELTAEELRELKVNYLYQLADSGEFAEIVGRDYDEPSMSDIANVDDILSDEFIIEHYEGVGFVEDDFFCDVAIED